MSDLEAMGEDKVWLTVGPDYGDSGEMVSRMTLPTDAFRTALTVDGGVLAREFGIEGAEDRAYEVWAVER